eukprot:3336723-Alexandrium_andersonii.AAC.1
MAKTTRAGSLQRRGLPVSERRTMSYEPACSVYSACSALLLQPAVVASASTDPDHCAATQIHARPHCSPACKHVWVIKREAAGSARRSDWALCRCGTKSCQRLV